MDHDQTTYSMGETVSLGCSATDDVDGDVACTYSGNVDSGTAGSYDITYTATDSSGNTATLVETYTITELMTYYQDVEGMTGTQLLDHLRILLQESVNLVTYGEARDILDETDADPNQAGNLILVYLGNSIDGTWDDGATWNREHVWPQSALPASASNGTANMASDLHNLKPADPGENSSRSNDYFTYDADGLSGTYEPRDEVKGDIARIMLYMIVMYDELSLVDGTPDLNNFEMALFTTLLEWHEADPVDDFERNRNDIIYDYQGNRNPFIDYEYFVDLIWGE